VVVVVAEVVEVVVEVEVEEVVVEVVVVVVEVHTVVYAGCLHCGDGTGETNVQCLQQPTTASSTVHGVTSCR
jgi:hypothetical protein